MKNKNKTNPKNKNKSDFIKYLDNYKKNQKLNSLHNLNHFLHNTSLDYMRNKYYETNYVGDTIVYSPPLLHTAPWNLPQPKLDIANLARDYYSIYNHSAINRVFEPIPMPTPPAPTHKKSAIIKKKVIIDLKVESLADLLQIIENYPYKEDEEYNIDLKTLVQIKDELKELNSMIGMEGLKKSILLQLLYFIQELHIIKTTDSETNHEKITHEFKHTVICGPPGTGKTEIAKIIGRMYSKVGILKSNIFKKVTRNDLVAGYLGQTALKTKSVITECLGGVLFIDEAYSLAPSNRGDMDSFSKECIDILCESLSDHKDNLMVIIAGYEEELNNTFFAANRGLESRFIWRFKIDDYNAKELHKIFLKKVGESDWVFDASFAIDDKWFEKNKKEFPFFGRDIEQLFSYTKICHSKRIYGKSLEYRKKITEQDLIAGLEMLIKNKKEKKKSYIVETMYV